MGVATVAHKKGNLWHSCIVSLSWSILKPVFRQINCDYKLLRFLNLEIWFFYAHNDNRTNKYLSYNGKYTCNRGDFFYFDKLLLKLYTSNTFKSLPLTTMAAYKYIPQSSREEASKTTWRQSAMMHINRCSLDIAKFPLTHIHHRLSYGSKHKDNNVSHTPKFMPKSFI